MPDAVPQSPPIICFGQQPCGFFPKRFLVAKIVTARRLQKEVGGEIFFFYHDSDHDPRETRTTVHHRQSGNPILLNFEFENKWQRKFSPLYLKRVPPEWSRKMAQQLGNYVEKPWVEAFRAVAAGPHAHNVANFCLDMYRHMGLLDGIRVMLQRPRLPPRRLRQRRLLRRRPLRKRNRPRPPRRRQTPTPRGRQRLHHPPAPARPLHARADQPHARQPPPLDAIRCTLHTLRLRRRRAGVPAKRGSPGNHLRHPRPNRAFR